MDAFRSCLKSNFLESKNSYTESLHFYFRKAPRSAGRRGNAPLQGLAVPPGVLESAAGPGRKGLGPNRIGRAEAIA